MYQFTTTSVINSQYAKDYNGNTLYNASGVEIPMVAGSATALTVFKVNKFLKDNIVSIYKRPFQAGVKEVAKVTIPQIAAGLTARLDIVLRLSQSTQSEYTNYSLDFLKPITVEIVATNVAATDAQSLVDQLNSLKNRFGHSYVTAVKINASDIQITCKEDVQRVQSMKISKSASSYNSIIDPQYEDVTASTFSVTTAGKVGFGDDAWMMSHIILPTAENVRQFGISKNERPIIGGNYSQYTLRYSVAKDGTDGIVGGGNSITTHVFYVTTGETARFEEAIAAVGLTVGATLRATASNGGGLAVGTPKYVNTTTNATDQIVITGYIGTLTFTSSDTDKGTVSATGLVTPTTDIGAFTVTVKDSLGNEDVVYYSAYTSLVATASDTTGTTPATAKSLDTSDNATDPIAVSGGAGTITYSTNEPTVAEVGTTGIVTTANDTGTGSVIITVTDSIGNVDYVYYTVVA